MPKKASLEPKTGQVNVKRGNGDIYIYERTTKYNPEKRFNEVISSHLVGKIPAGKTEMVSTRPRRAKASVPKLASSKRIGVACILEWIGRESGIDQDLLHATDRTTAEKILSIARYWNANPGKTIPYIEEWQINHDIPYRDGISQDGCYALMKAIGTDADMQQKFFRARADRVPSKSSIAFDSTTVSSYSENQIEARYGYNKSDDGLKSVKLLTQYCLETGQPIAYARQPGNIPDVISIINASKQLSVFGMEKPMFVMDAGFYSEDNMLTLIRSHIKFLVAGKLNASWIKSEFDGILNSISQLSNHCPFDPSVYGMAIATQHNFRRVRERSRSNISKGDVVTEEHRIYLYLYRNAAKAECDTASLADDIRKVQEHLKAEVQPISEGERRIADKYLMIRNTRGGLSITYNEEAFQDATRFAGCFILVSNAPLDVWDALRKYRRREKIEEHFRMDKQYVDGNRTRVWYPDSLSGRFFCQFVALCYHEYLHQAISNLKKTLAIKNGDPLHDTEQNLKEEKALLNWLNSMSIERLFAWFDCIEETTVYTNMSKCRWQTETIKRDRLFLSRLGIIRQ
ncbi:MAG: transposase [Oscillospiraceae bacterium]|jgi:transposase|nr:transposase [Oscillospiraceae bacterium]